jgi:hypothetical protein
VKQIRKRLTYANVMSSIAVFLVLGGATAFAAAQLGKNTVGAKQLKRNAVVAAKIKNSAITTEKVKDGSLLGSDFQSGQLPQGAVGSEGPKGPKGDTGSVDLSRSSRVAFIAVTGDSVITATTTPFAKETITAPADGFLVAQTNLTLASATPASCPCVVRTQLKIDGGTPTIVASTNIGTAATDYVDTFDRRPMGGTEVFPVQAGTHTVVAESLVAKSSALTGLATANETLQILFVPFNGTGGTS